MNKSSSIKLKAAFLLAAFGLNTVVGFACSLGLDMGFNSKDHHQMDHDDHEATEAVVHIHSDGKKHIHYEKKSEPKPGKSHHHDENQNHSSSNDDKENCCTDQVLKIEQSDKAVPHSLNIIHPTFLISFFDVFYSVSLPTTDIVKNIKQFVRSYHPPIPNLRIAIQSFQI